MGDPRIHGAIVCASLSCPALLREPFEAERLDAQLDAVWRSWLADTRKGLRIDRGTKRVQLSKIFDWFEADFAAHGGVLRFIGRYLSDADAKWLAANRDAVRITYFDYDWSLNTLSR